MNEIKSYWLEGEEVGPCRHEIMSWGGKIDRESGKWKIENVKDDSPVHNLFKILRIRMVLIKE
jgi:hypothetical protein